MSKDISKFKQNVLQHCNTVMVFEIEPILDSIDTHVNEILHSKKHGINYKPEFNLKVIPLLRRINYLIGTHFTVKDIFN